MVVAGEGGRTPAGSTPPTYSRRTCDPGHAPQRHYHRPRRPPPPSAVFVVVVVERPQPPESVVLRPPLRIGQGRVRLGNFGELAIAAAVVAVAVFIVVAVVVLATTTTTAKAAIGMVAQRRRAIRGPYRDDGRVGGHAEDAVRIAGGGGGTAGGSCRRRSRRRGRRHFFGGDDAVNVAC